MIEQKIRDFFVEKAVAGELALDTDLFEGGYINSLFAFEMIVYLEQTFQVKIEDNEINENNFRSIGSIVELVKRAKGD